MTRALGLKTRSTSPFVACALVATLLVQPGAARAQSEGTAPSTNELRKQQAKAKYEQGVELYRNERYADAVRQFLEADALSPSAALSFNIARAYEKLSDDAATLRWYRNYLRLNPEAPNAAEVRQSIQTLSQSLAKKGIQQLTVLSTPTGATVAIDDRALGVTPLTVELRPGPHHALITLRGFTDVKSEFTLAAASPLDLPFELTPAPSAGARVTGTSSPSPAQEGADASGARPRRFGIAPYVVLGAGAAALGASLIFEESRRSAQDSVRTDETQIATQRDIDAMNSRQTSARILLGVGGVLAATGATLLILNTRVTPESSARVSALPGGAGLSYTRSF